MALGLRRAVAPRRAAPEGVPYPELVAQAKRRTFTAQHKARIVAETEACTRPRDSGKPGASSGGIALAEAGPLDGSRLRGESPPRDALPPGMREHHDTCLRIDDGSAMASCGLDESHQSAAVVGALSLGHQSSHQRARGSLPVPCTQGVMAPPTSHARASSNAGLDPRLCPAPAARQLRNRPGRRPSRRRERQVQGPALSRKEERVLARSWLIPPPGSAEPGRRRDDRHSSRAIVTTQRRRSIRAASRRTGRARDERSVAKAIVGSVTGRTTKALAGDELDNPVPEYKFKCLPCDRAERAHVF